MRAASGYRQDFPATVAFEPAIGGATRVGLAELALYAFTLAMATGPLDQMIQQHMLSDPQRAAVWAAIYAGFGLVVLSRPSVVARAIAGIWPLLILPALALLSTTWSGEPGTTVVASLEMTASALFGAIIGCRITEGRLLGLVVGVLVALSVVDLAVVATSPIGLDINNDAVGLFSHKNIHGEVMTVLVLASLAVLVFGGRRMLALCGLLLGLVLLAWSGSRTSWVVSAIAIAATAFLSLRPTARVFMALGGILLACIAGMVWLAHPVDLFGLFLNATDKDPTLTGRTVLWNLALGFIREYPMLGQGFNGFWSTDPTTPGAFVDRVLRQTLPHFHNGYLEMAVELGWIGAALLIAAMASFVKPIGRLLAHGNRAAAAFAVALLIVVAVGNVAEVMLFVRHGFHLMLIAALWSRASQLGRTQPAAMAPPPRPEPIPLDRAGPLRAGR